MWKTLIALCVIGIQPSEDTCRGYYPALKPSPTKEECVKQAKAHFSPKMVSGYATRAAMETGLHGVKWRWQSFCTQEDGETGGDRKA